MAQPFIAQQQPSPIDMMTGPQPPQQAYAPVQPYPNQPYPTQPYPNPNQPIYPPGQPLVLQAAYVQMPAACPVGAPVSVQQGATKDTAHMPYMLSLLGITVFVFIVGCGIFVAGLFKRSTMVGYLVAICICSAFSALLAYFNHSSTIEFDKQSQMMHVTTRLLLLHFCPTRVDLPFTTPVNVTLHDTGMSIGSSHRHRRGSTSRDVNRIYTIQLRMQGHDVDVQRGYYPTMSGVDVQWRSYLRSIGVNAT